MSTKNNRTSQRTSTTRSSSDKILNPEPRTLPPIHVRVFSEYSDIPNTTNPDFPEQNIRFEARERKSTLISKFNFCSAHPSSHLNQTHPSTLSPPATHTSQSTEKRNPYRRHTQNPFPRKHDLLDPEAPAGSLYVPRANVSLILPKFSFPTLPFVAMRDTSAEPTPLGQLAGIDPPAPSRWSPTENGIVWTLWFTYGVFYFCRNNLSLAAPGLKMSLAEGGLALPASQVAWILASSKIAYGLGQLLNGQLSERISPRVMLAVGMFGSAALNVLFGMGAGFFFLLFVWGTNGVMQSLGWSPCMRVTANWIPIERRGKAIGIIGTGYQITQGLTYVVAGQAAQHFGWRGALYVPAAIVAASGVFMLMFLRDSPADEPTATQDRNDAPPKKPRISVSDGLYWTLYNPALWLLGLSLGLLNACRYGFLDWGVTHLMETQNIRVGAAGLQFFVIAIGATAGSYLAGWATDRFFGGRRAPVICLLMLLLGVLTLGYDTVVHESAIATMVLLVVIGFCIFGPQVLLVGTAPTDLAHRNTSAAAAGFVNFMGYLGAAIGDVVTGYYSSPENGGWVLAIKIWAGWAFAGAIITAGLWNTTSRKVGILPAVVPKLGSLFTLALAAVAISYGGQPMALQIATYVAAACLLGSWISRWAGVPAMIVGLVGILTVFMAYLQTQESVTWDQVTAMVAYGLCMITSLMILVEKKGER